VRIRALDSIRGLLLLQMTLDHFGRPISYYLYMCFGFFSAAEGFFFLSGFVGMLAAISKSTKDSKQSWMRWRAFKTWRYHIATLLCMSLMGFFLVPGIYPYFKEIFQHPLPGILYSLTLVNTPEWLDVLPLYVIYLLIGSFILPLFVKAKNKTQVFLLWLPSLVVWLWGQFGLRALVNSIFPDWISHGTFDPFSWQCVYFTGAAVAAWWKLARRDEADCGADDGAGKDLAIRVVKKLTPAVLVLLAFCCLWSHHVIPLPQPTDFLISREHVGILRFGNFFLFVMGICWIVRRWPKLLDFRPTNVLGRHSLDVYTAHIIMIYFWLATPGSIRYHGPWNVVVPLTTCILLWVLAKLREPKAKHLQ